MRARTRRLGNLPCEVSSFVGRESEAREIHRLLSETRLLTLTGAGGVGKTRLAVHTAAQVYRAFPDGVWLVDLAPLRDGTLVDHTVARSLGIHDARGAEPLTLVTEFLRDRTLLLVLDNCEHLIDACATTSDAILTSAAGVRVLATSREALRVSGEHTYPLSPLPFPRAWDPQWWVTRPAEQPEHCAAVTLFLQRAGAAAPAFTDSDTTRRLVTEICRRLDGLPLALELAAARLRVLTPEQLLDRLDELVGRPGVGRRAGQRHATLAAAIEWSHDLCSAEEQAVWAQASVFAGHFGADAARRVCTGRSEDAAETADPDLALAGLVEKSILVREEHDSAVRYRMLDSIRCYGRRELAATGHAERVRLRHADWYFDLVTRAHGEWFGPEQLTWFRRLAREHGQLRSALDCYLETGRTRTALRMATMLWFYWTSCGLIGEGRHWLDRCLARHEDSDGVRARGLLIASYLAAIQADLDRSTRQLAQARRIARGLGDETLMARLAAGEGRIAMMTGDVRTGLDLMWTSLRRLRTVARHDDSAAALTLFALSLGHSAVGELDTAVRLGHQGVELCHAHGDSTSQGLALYGCALAELLRGRYRKCVQLARRALRLRRELPDPASAPLNVDVLACAHAGLGECERAAALHGVAYSICRTFGVSGLLECSLFAPRHGGSTDSVRRRLGAAAYDAAFGRGASLGIADGITLALDDRRPRAAAAPAPANLAAAPALSRRELQVAGLVAEGLSNKQIAARLTIADRTTETHVAHILRKLGLHSRTQIATWVVTR